MKIDKSNSYITICIPSITTVCYMKNGEVSVFELTEKTGEDLKSKYSIGFFRLNSAPNFGWILQKFNECVNIPRNNIDCFSGDKVHFMYNELSPISDNTAIVTQNSKYNGKMVYTREDLKYFPSVIYAAVL